MTRRASSLRVGLPVGQSDRCYPLGVIELFHEACGPKFT